MNVFSGVYFFPRPALQVDKHYIVLVVIRQAGTCKESLMPM